MPEGLVIAALDEDVVIDRRGEDGHGEINRAAAQDGAGVELGRWSRAWMPRAVTLAALSFLMSSQ
jgi:hypothetical protein